MIRLSFIWLCIFMWVTPAYAQLQSEMDELRTEALLGDATSAFKYGERLQRGLPGEKPDYEGAVHWYKIAAQQGNADALITLADLYSSGIVTPPTPSRAKELYEHAYRVLRADAERGYASAATRLGLMFFHGHGVDPDTDLAIKWLQRGVELDNPQAKFVLGRLTVWGTTSGYSSDDGLELLKKAADEGVASAWLRIGLAYSGAFGRRVNHYRAVEAFKKAADMGSEEGMRKYGISLLTGLGIEKDEAKGATYIKKAAKGGNSEAMYNLALLYHQGVGLKKDDKESFKWMKRASDFKVADADYHLALAYHNGQGVPKSKEKTLKHLKMAQRKKHVLAIKMYEELTAKDKADQPIH